MLKMKKVTEMYGKSVYTEEGDYFGEIDELVIEGNKISGWKVRASKGSLLAKTLGGVKGVLIPHQLVKAVGDIIIVSQSTISTEE